MLNLGNLNPLEYMKKWQNFQKEHEDTPDDCGWDKENSAAVVFSSL
jgi:hypothetical protein